MEISPTALKKNLTDLLNHVAKTGERIIVVSRGKVKAAIISAEELELLQDMDEAVAMWDEDEGVEAITLEELEAELGLIEGPPPPKPSKKRK